MAKFTEQYAFNKIWRYFVRDGNKRAIHKYQNEQGHVCPVGLLMTKKERDKLQTKMLCLEDDDNIIISANSARVDELKSHRVLPRHLDAISVFLMSVQELNDENDRFGRVKERAGLLRDLANRYDLTVPTR